jgi:hypothetical protein
LINKICFGSFIKVPRCQLNKPNAYFFLRINDINSTM